MDKAKWIWLSGEQKEDTYGDFFESFVFSGEKGARAAVKISACGDYALYVNEKLAGFGQYADFPWYKVYDEVDITPFLKEGKNDIRITVWYYGRETLNYYKSAPGVIYEVFLCGNAVAYSGKNTLCAEAAGYVSELKKNITWQLGFSYRYDFNKKNLARQSAVELDRARDLVLRPIERLTLLDSFSASLIDKKNNIYDLKKERVGFLDIRFCAEKGAVLNVAFGERLVNGKVPRIIGDRDFSVEYIASGGTDEFTPPLRRIAGRYLQVSCSAPFNIEYIGLSETLYPVEQKPFNTDNPLRRQIYDTAVRTLHLCMHDRYEDCPWREQGFYMLDSRFQMRYSYYAYSGYGFQRAALSLFGEDRRSDNMLSMCVPSSVDMVIPSFALFYTVAINDYLNYSGDKSLAKKYYGKMTALLDVYITRIEDGLVPNFYGDAYWNFYEWSEGMGGNYAKDYRFDAALNTMLSLSLISMHEICLALDKKEESAYYLNLSKELNKCIKNKFFDEKSGLFSTFGENKVYHELVNSCAVLCGAAQEKTAENICAALAGKNTMTAATLSMTALKYDALLLTDRAKYAGYVLSDIDKNFESMLKAGATSFWETAGGGDDFYGAGSLCHGWSALAIYYYKILQEESL